MLALAYLNATAGSSSQTNWWYTPLLSGIFALVGVSIAQGVVLYLARRNDQRRSEPELLKHCADFSAACGRLKRELALKKSDERNYDSINLLDSSYDALIIIGTPEIEGAAERFIGSMYAILDTEQSKDKSALSEQLRQLFRAHIQFIDAVRAHFDRPKKVYMALPMLKFPEKQTVPKGWRKWLIR